MLDIVLYITVWMGIVFGQRAQRQLIIDITINQQSNIHICYCLLSQFRDSEAAKGIVIVTVLTKHVYILYNSIKAPLFTVCVIKYGSYTIKIQCIIIIN